MLSATFLKMIVSWRLLTLFPAQDIIAGNGFVFTLLNFVNSKEQQVCVLKLWFFSCWNYFSDSQSSYQTFCDRHWHVIKRSRAKLHDHWKRKVFYLNNVYCLFIRSLRLYLFLLFSISRKQRLKSFPLFLKTQDLGYFLSKLKFAPLLLSKSCLFLFIEWISLCSDHSDPRSSVFLMLSLKSTFSCHFFCSDYK